MRHSRRRCQTVRAQYVSDLEDLGAFWQVRKIDCYSSASLFSSSCFLVCSSQRPQIRLWRCGIVKQARGWKDWRGILPLWIPATRPGGAPSLSALAVTTAQLRWVLSASVLRVSEVTKCETYLVSPPMLYPSLHNFVSSYISKNRHSLKYISDTKQLSFFFLLWWILQTVATM